jgi:hypothetical protein
MSSCFLYINTIIKAYIIITFSAVLYGCETLSTTSKHRLMVFDYRVLRKIFGSMKEETTGGWREMQPGEM